MAHKPLSKTLMVKCGYSDMEILDQNLRVHCRDKHNSVKFAAGSTHITSFFPPKSDHKRKLSSSSSDPKKLCVSNSESENQESTSDSILNTETDAPSPSEPDEQQPTSSISANADAKLDEILACVKDIQVSLKTLRTLGLQTYGPFRNIHKLCPSPEKIFKYDVSRMLLSEKRV